MRVTELGLSRAVLGRLRAADITDVDQLVRLTGDELIHKGIDGAELYEVICRLNRRGLSLPPLPGLSFRRLPDERDRTMLRLRLIEGLPLDEVGERIGLSQERVRQLLRALFGITGRPQPVVARRRTKTARRRAANLARAQEHADDLLVRWRQGAAVGQLADAFDLTWASVEEVIQTVATDADRAARAAARSTRRRRRPQRWR